MRIDKPRRAKKAAKRLDLSDMRAVLRDGRRWTSIGLVVKPGDGSPHWRIVQDDQNVNAVDVLVDVVLQPSQIPVVARLAAGMFVVPAIGEEVAVIIPDGEIDFMPVIACILSSNVVPSTQGPTPTRIVLVRGEVVIHDGAGGAEALVKRSEYNGHTHLPGTFAAGVTAVLGVSGGADDVTGTTVLKAK